MKHRFILLLVYSSFYTLSAQTKYGVSSIPPNLVKYATVVVRDYELKFEVLNKAEAIETEHKVLTLLNDGAADEIDQVFWYDQIQIIESIEGAVYDASGKLVRRLKKKDIEDQKAFEQQFVDDSRAKILKFPRLSFPYTIEYTVVTKHKGLMFYPIFEPQEAPWQSVESAKFQIFAPESLKVRVKEINMLPEQLVGAMHWEFRNLPAFKPEPFLPLGYSELPRIVSAPTLFSIEGYDGDMTTWESYGKFINTLNAGKVNLTPETEAKLRDLTANCPDQLCKAHRVYELLQNSTRYYFVGLGIGGWQPMPAGDVDKFKYSDCKGLSNYALAMLKAVGVPAHYALIRAGADEVNAQMDDFPNPFFNHATLCIPMVDEMIWLECTSQKQSFGFLSDFTDDRPALLITPDGGKIVYTPKYDYLINTSRSVTTVELNADGSAKFQSNDTFRGIEQDIPAQLSDLPDGTRKTYLYKVLNISDFEITALAYERKKDLIPEVEQKISLNIPQLASVSGKRLFLPLTFMAEIRELPMVQQPRQNPVQAHSRGMTEEDSIEISIPAGFTLENTLPSVSINSVFGHYDLTLQQAGSQITVYRKLVLNNDIQPKEKFDELLSFLKKVSKADQTMVVLVK